MNHVTTVLLVRHADPVHPIGWSGDEYTRPLTDQGRRDARVLADTLRPRRIDAVYSSPYRRAIESVAPLAADRGLSVQLVDDFREHRLVHEPVPHYRQLLEASWLDFGAAPGGAETLAATQQRGLVALEAARRRHPGETLAVGGHGTLFACLLHANHPGIDCAFLLAMPMPAVYELVHTGTRWEVRSGPGIAF